MEFQDFGWNVMTVSFLGTVIFSLVRAWGYWLQTRTIWIQRSGLSVPVTNYTYMTIGAAAVAVYGVRIGSWALIINGLLTILFRVPILIGLWKFKGFGRWEKLASLGFMAALAGLILIPVKAEMLLAFSVGGILVAVLQPYEIWRNRDAGAVEIRLLFVGLANSTFWIAYGFAIADPVLRLTYPIFFLITLATIILWFRFKKRPERTRGQ